MATEKFKAVLQVHSVSEAASPANGGRVMLFLPNAGTANIGQPDTAPASYIEVVLDTPADELLSRFPATREERDGKYFMLTLSELSTAEVAALAPTPPETPEP